MPLPVGTFLMFDRTMFSTLLLERGYKTQTAFAAALNMSRTRINSIANGLVPTETMRSVIAGFLGVSVDTLWIRQERHLANVVPNRAA